MTLSFIPFSSLASKIYGALAIAAIAVAGVQSARLNGIHLGPIGLTGWIRTAQDRASERDAEIRAHRLTKQTYRAAQAIAAQLERDRLARVRAEQETIRHATVEEYQSRLADLRTRAERLRREAAARTGAAGAGGAGAVPGLSVTGAGAAEAPGDPGLPRTFEEQLARDLIASEQAEQLDALIDFVIAQHGVDPNTPPH